MKDKFLNEIMKPTPDWDKILHLDSPHVSLPITLTQCDISQHVLYRKKKAEIKERLSTPPKGYVQPKYIDSVVPKLINFNK